jgi:transcriptional regulator with XRE-family HTH domain
MPTETVELHKPTSAESQSTFSVSEQLFHNFCTGREYRHAFVEEKVRTSIATQIKAIREQRGLKQPEFAQEMGKSQSWVSRLEDANQAPPTIPSLLKVAEALDVDLEIRFGRFSELLQRLDAMTPESFEVPSFDEELKHGILGAAPQEFLYEYRMNAAQWSVPPLQQFSASHYFYHLNALFTFLEEQPKPLDKRNALIYGQASIQIDRSLEGLYGKPKAA